MSVVDEFKHSLSYLTGNGVPAGAGGIIQLRYEPIVHPWQPYFRSCHSVDRVIDSSKLAVHNKTP